MKVLFSRSIYLCVAVIVLTPPVASIFGYAPAYGVFQLVRIAVTVGAVAALIAAAQSDRIPLVPVFAIVAIVFNPVVPLRFAKSDWELIDWAVGGLFLVWAVLVRRRRIDNPAAPPVLPTIQLILLLLLVSVAVDIRERLQQELRIGGTVGVEGTVDVSGSVAIDDYDEPIAVRVEPY